MERNWIARGDDFETAELFIDQQTYGYVSRYEGGMGGYNWQAQRGASLDIGTAPTLEAAKREAERHIDMPIGEFNAIAALKLIKRRDELNAALAQLGYDSTRADGDRYHLGYTEGFEAARVAILEALDNLRAYRIAPKQPAAQVPA